jgi:hypothetical protein
MLFVRYKGMQHFPKCRIFTFCEKCFIVPFNFGTKDEKKKERKKMESVGGEE